MAAPWTPAQKAKFKATMAAKRAARNMDGSTPVSREVESRLEDAEGYLRQAIRIQDKLLKEGKIKRRDAAHLLAELALKTLEGEL